ncbi:MAG TPA: ABC transporter substrate-binding protein [Gaiellaceae bacterium]|nr:ABC transporter substrate-binding protein [Gaiellaceae bacterium]
MNTRWLRIAVLAAIVGATTVLAAPSAGSPTRRQLDTVTVDTLPIANGFPLDVGIKQGFFEKQGIQIKKQVLQSGNDIVLAMANHNGDIGYIGYVPAMIARTQGIPVQVVAASEVEGTSADDNWQNVVVRGSSSIRSPADLAGKTIAVNALKGLAEVVVRGALKKVGVDPNSVKLVAIPFPAMRTALNNGQVDAAHTPEPFLSQILGDGGRIVLAPGPTLGRYWPNGCYVGLEDWAAKNPGLAKRFRTAINQALAYSQTHPDDIRALLPPALRNIRLPVWSPLIDRAQLLELAQLTKEFGVITTLPNFNKLVPGTILSGQTFQVIVGKSTRFTLSGKPVKTVKAGTYNFAVTDRSKTASFRLVGPGVRRSTSVAGTGTVTWTVALRAGTYRYGSGSKLTQSFTVT